MVPPEEAFSHHFNIMPGFIIYCRKSTEAEDRQVLSIESQVRELRETAAKLGLPVAEVLTEAMSAKAPGRPVFNQLMQRLYKGEAAGIICWKLDRLARNPVDGGSIIWAIKQHRIRVVTPAQHYSHDEDNVILMYIEFGMAQKYVDDLSKNVKRGLKTKIEKGGYPGVAPMGYLNFTDRMTGEKRLIEDPERFPVIRRMWDLMLTGLYTPPQIREVANNQWGFRTRKTRKTGGNPLARSGIYKVFTSPFYYGWFQLPRKGGEWHQGNHPPMVTQAEYDRVQMVLGRRGNPRPSARRNFPFTGLIRCGECGGMVTAEEKHQLRCDHCHYKFSSLNRDACPRCRTRIDKMTAPKRHQYTYYHCTKTKNPHCPQGCVSAEDLAKQIDDYLARITISADFKEWAVKYLQVVHEAENQNRVTDTAATRKAFDACQARLNNLVTLKTSPENGAGRLLSDEEYARQRSDLLQEKTRLQAILGDNGETAERCFQQASSVFETAATARLRFAEGDPQTQREILAAVGSNRTLKDRILSIEPAKPFRIIEDGLSGTIPETEPIEPAKTRLAEGWYRSLDLSCPSLCGDVDDVRTAQRRMLRLAALIYQHFSADFPTSASS